MQRRNIEEPLSTGIRAIDAALTIGKGQRVGIFAGSGVGKSTVMAMIARYASSDVNVIALVGERGREVREFIERALGPEGLARSVVVVATSDEPALLKMQAAMVATTIAESFRASGRDVTLLMDSVTRYAMANREIGLAIGEPPTMKGYPPSVFSALSRLLERAGTSDEGTITAFYAVLVESDDLTEPITDAVRGTLDGHIVLTRELAAQNHFPAIDLLQSTSRVMPSIVSRPHIEAAGRLRELLATYERSRDLVTIGAYQAGTDARLDEVLQRLPAIEGFLRQRPDEVQPLEVTIPQLIGLVGLDAAPPLPVETGEPALEVFDPLEPAFVPAETD
jgi:FliI/YscN family ATPase